MQILVPISGYSKFFPKEEYYFPKPLIEVCGKPMIELVINHLQGCTDNTNFTFVIDPEDLRSFSLDRTLCLIAGGSTTIVEKPGSTGGALCSCLLAIDTIDPDQPILISNSDQIIEEGIIDAINFFKEGTLEAGIVTFDSTHPRWSYVINNNEGEIVQAFEKRVASRNAIAGIYYFKKASLFFEAAKRVLLNNAHVDGSYYVSSALNEIILKGGRVLSFSINTKHYHSFYAPSKIAEFERTLYASRIRKTPLVLDRVNIIIPAAGQGSRFSNLGWRKPKPFIDVGGKSMIEHVMENVKATNSSMTILLRQEHLDSHPEDARNIQSGMSKVIPIPCLTEGTASTVLLARNVFNNDRPLIIANSDQVVDFDINLFIGDCLYRKLDGSILVFVDPSMDPKWSYVQIDEYGLVTEVAEKNPISDLATAGIYVFTRGKDFVESALDMILANDRTNNEFYTCPVYSYMIKRGARIGVYQVPMNAMHGLGTPVDLENFMRKRLMKPSQDIPN